MSQKHLPTGSAKPPKVEGKLRLYSMQFCPYAERVRIVLLRKQIPHDIVNVDLKRKPEWLFPLNPKGLVPVLDTGTEVITESIEICEYLEKNYPKIPLYPEDEEQCKKDKQFIRFCDGLFNLFYRAIRNPENQSLSQHLENIEPFLVKLENELLARGSYFGGESPNIVDFMIWPWAERANDVRLSYNEDLPDEEQYPMIYSWCKEMRKVKEIQETVTSADRLYKFILAYKSNSSYVEYDSI